MKHMEHRTFDFCYDAFSEKRQFTKEGRNYENVRQALVNKF